MKTNTNTLRRALETFAKTGKITLTASALMALALSAPVNAETVTGNKTISSDYTPSENVLVIGTQTESGTIDVTGGTMNITGGVANDFRGKNASIQIINGTLTLSNATINTTNGVALNASEGNTASLVVNNGGKLLISGKYPVMGSEVGQSGTLTINEGGYVETLYTDANQTDDITFYVSGNGSGTVNLYGGTLKVSGGLQVARAYGSDDGAGVAGSHGTLNMTGGTLDVGKYFIFGHNHPGTGDPNIGIFNMSGGKVTVGKNTDETSVKEMQYFLVGCSDAGVTTDKIQCQANISGNSEMVINGYVEISNGEWYPTVGSGTTTPSSMTVSDNAQITVKGPYFGVGSWGKLNMNGGSILYDPLYPASSYGMANAGEMNLAGGKITTTHQFQNVSQGTVTISSAESSLTIGGDVENSGKLVISAGLLDIQNTSTIKGAGSLDISGGELRAKDSTLNYSGKTLNYSGGILPETLNLTNTALAISNTADWNVTSVNDTNGSTLSVAFTPDGTGTVLGNTTFTGFDTADVTLKFAEGVNNQRLTSYAMTNGKITYETAAAKNLVLNRGTDILEADTLSGFASLQTGDVIDVTANVTEKTPVFLPAGDMTIRSNSAGTRTMTIQNGNLFFFEGTGSLTAENIKFTGGTGFLSGEGRYGGAIYADGESTFTLNGGIFEKNSALGSLYNKSLGGVLCGENAQITGVEFKSNAAGYGGAIYANTSVDIADSSFVANSASITNSLGYSKGSGGAVYSPSVTVSNSSFKNNTAGSSGGAVYGPSVTVSNSSFKNNTAGSSGGAVYGTEVHLKDTHFEGNIAGDMTVDGSTTSGSYGGAVYVGSQGGSLSGTNTFIGNQAESGGGAIYVRSQYDGYKEEKTQFVISGNNTFIDNHGGAEDFNGTNAGAILLAGSSELVFEGADSTAVFKGNTGGSSNKPNDILGSGYNNVTIKDGGNYVFEGGISLDSKRLNGNGEYIDGTLTIGQAGQNGAPVVTFGGDSVNKFTSLAVTNDSIVTFQDGAKLTIVNGGTVDGATLNLEGNVDFAGKLTMTNTTANFNADPTVNGFTTLNADQFSGTVNVGLNVFTVGAMDNTTNTVTLIDGAKAENVKITNGNLMTNANVDGKTAVTINQDKDGTTYGSAPVQGSELVGIDFEKGQTSMTVKDFSLIVDGSESETFLQDFADWLGDETGLETAVGTGYVSVRLDSPFEIMSTDSFIWDFSGFNGDASLQFVTANIMDNTVPEPTTWALLVLGGLGVFGVARKNRKAKK